MPSLAPGGGAEENHSNLQTPNLLIQGLCHHVVGKSLYILSIPLIIPQAIIIIMVRIRSGICYWVLSLILVINLIIIFALASKGTVIGRN